MSKNYLIFSGIDGTRGGGWKDFYASADTLEDAVALYKSARMAESKTLSFRWAQIVCLKTSEIVRTEELDQFDKEFEKVVEPIHKIERIAELIRQPRYSGWDRY
jgi:hypothetical protein